MNHSKTRDRRRIARTAIAAAARILASGVLVAAALTPFRAGAQDRGPVAALVRTLEVGRPVSYGNLTIVPVYTTAAPRRADFATLEDAVRNRWIEITELDGGRVPQVRISNLSGRTIFVMGGEILTGARQDRILASDLLLGPWTKNLVAPVYCVEHGRWTAVSETFTTKSNVGTFELRAAAQAKAADAQSEIWNRVAEQNRRVGVASPTGAYQDAYEAEANKQRIEKIEQRLAGIPSLNKDTVGVVIGLGGRIVSADVFADPALFGRQWPKILRSAALSSIGFAGTGEAAQRGAADFLRSFLDRGFQARKGLDLGTEYSSVDGGANIQALAHQGAVLHLAAFPGDDGRIKVVDDRSPDQTIRVIRD